VRVNAPVGFEVLHLAPLWGDFMKDLPNIELDIESERPTEVDLVDEGFDAAVRIAHVSFFAGRTSSGEAQRMYACVPRPAIWRTILKCAP